MQCPSAASDNMFAEEEILINDFGCALKKPVDYVTSLTTVACVFIKHERPVSHNGEGWLERESLHFSAYIFKTG